MHTMMFSEKNRPNYHNAFIPVQDMTLVPQRHNFAKMQSNCNIVALKKNIASVPL